MFYNSIQGLIKGSGWGREGGRTCNILKKRKVLYVWILGKGTVQKGMADSGEVRRLMMWNIGTAPGCTGPSRSGTVSIYSGDLSAEWAFVKSGSPGRDACSQIHPSQWFDNPTQRTLTIPGNKLHLPQAWDTLCGVFRGTSDLWWWSFPSFLNRAPGCWEERSQIKHFLYADF